MVRTCSYFCAVFLLVACAGPAAQGPGTSETRAASSATISAQEREAAVKNLEETRRAFLASIQGMSDAQFRYKPSPERWSAAEVAEHIVITEERLFGMVTEKMMRTPTDKDLLAQVQHDDNRIMQAVTDRSQRVKAPEMLQPTGRFPTLEAVTTAFGQVRDKTVSYVQTTQDDLRGHAMPHPFLKALDGYQALLLASAHCARHTAQIEEVKVDPHYPRS